MDKDEGMATEIATIMDDIVEPPVFECNAIYPYLGTTALAVDMIQTIKDKTVCGICTNQIIINWSPGQIHTSSLVLVFVGRTKQSLLHNQDILLGRQYTNM